MSVAQSDRLMGLWILVAAALCWSLGGVLIKLVDLNPIGIAGARSAIAVPLIAAFLLSARRGSLSSRFIPAEAGIGTLLLGIVAYAGTVSFFVIATKLTTAANAILLQYTAPIWVALLGPALLKEPTTRVDWFAILVAFGGMSVFFLEDVSSGARTGDLLALCAGLCFALCILSLRKGRGGSNLHMVLYGNILTAAICLPFLDATHFGSNDIVPLLLLGLVQLGLGYLLFTHGIRRVQAVDGALVPVIEPILNPLWVLLLVDESPSIYSVAGGAVVLVAVTGRAVWYARRARKERNR